MIWTDVNIITCSFSYMHMLFTETFILVGGRCIIFTLKDNIMEIYGIYIYIWKIYEKDNFFVLF